MRYEFPRRNVVITLAATDPDESAAIEYEGEEDAVFFYQTMTSRAYGMFGHPIEDEATPMDLHFVMETLFKGQYTLVEGQDVLDSYEPLDEGLKT
ncbi:hypothetical protein [Phormidium tenue]|uniref:Uncharacterized protein n=1 Tax=Phormidium tenue NIES-30 TaxID=549789 RepID=A0A1U7IY58_9CYAN|nr:hypothetical protein [Phormidium tenue]MBD2234938.1 hypothetical protein [Phormidium tenue FACHB-1052]OKH43475.1 hypothetical protein NIES30_25025 [Phormidium tenue NIES-30]